MASSLQLDGLGSSTAVVTWDDTSDGSVYTLDLQDTNGDTLTSIETQETSATFHLHQYQNRPHQGLLVVGCGSRGLRMAQ